MLTVEIVVHEDSALILRARGSELLVLPAHCDKLHSLKDKKLFAQYFMDHAMINRPARKLFEAWLRKDSTLWRRVFESVQGMTGTSASKGSAPKSDDSVAKPQAPAEAKAKTEEAPKAKKPVDKPDAPAKTAKSEAPTKKTAATTPKAAAAPKSATKPKASAKPAVKAAAKPATKAAASKSSATKSTKPSKKG